MPIRPLTKGEQRDVEIIGRTFKRLEERGISFVVCSGTLHGLRGGKQESPAPDDVVFTIEGCHIDETEAIVELEIISTHHIWEV